MGLRSAARNNKATRLLTRPGYTSKSSAKDSSQRAVKLLSANYLSRLLRERSYGLLRSGAEAYSYPRTTCWRKSSRSGMDSNLEAFSYYPADGSFAALPGRADIEGSKSNVAMNAWLPQASYPCGNFSGTSSLKFRGTKGSIGHTFMVCIHTENQNQGDFCPFALLEISVLHESPLGHLRYGLTDVPPQPNSPPDNVINPDQPAKDFNARKWSMKTSSASLIK
uniref:Senescence-associated protein n=2 Tax=Eukaryota TaxID=2759 RepID=A0A7N2N833_QUELO